MSEENRFKEGLIRKGGVNRSRPKSPRPEPPKPQRLEKPKIITKEYSDDRKSLAQEIAETLKTRNYWTPKAYASADLVMAVGKALDELRKENEKLKKTNEYNPDYVSHPCETLKELSEDCLFNEVVKAQIDFIDKHLGVITKHLSKKTNPPESFWRNRILDYYKGLK